MKHTNHIKLTMALRSWVLGLLLITLAGLAERAHAQDFEVVNPNGSFENSNVTVSGDTTSVEGWNFFVQDGATGSYAIIDSVVKDGSRALAVTITGTGTQDWSLGAVNEPVLVQPNQTYTLTLWARASESGATANFTIGETQAKNFNELGRIGSSQVTLTTEWREFSVDFTVPAGTDTVRTPLHFSFARNIGKTIYIDSVRITRPIIVEEPVQPRTPMAHGKSKWLGNIYSPSQIENFEFYWNQVTPENAGKWGSVEPTRGNYNWGALDNSYRLAKDNGFPFRFHILVWGGQQPSWINNLSSDEQLVAITQWFDAVAERYPEMEYVEVVNEGSNGHQLPDGQSGSANYINALGGTGETGHDWIITAFEMARERFPNSKLMINDYNIVSSNTWNTQNARNYRRIIEDLQERGLIDVIGVQAHAFSTVGTQAQMRSVLNYLAETGLPIQATEMDIDGIANVTPFQSDQRQLDNIRRIFPVFWEHPAVEGVTFWGWRPGLWRQAQDAYLIRSNGEERPALQWLREYVELTELTPPVSTEKFDDSLPSEFELSGNYPNPFNPVTSITYKLPMSSHVRLVVYDMTGRQIQTLVNAQQASGTHTYLFDASNLSSGLYLYELQAGSFRDVRKMMLIK